nr:MAG TPA: hypothetical protein [Caudoviricetes sp.]
MHYLCFKWPSYIFFILFPRFLPFFLFIGILPLLFIT